MVPGLMEAAAKGTADGMLEEQLMKLLKAFLMAFLDGAADANAEGAKDSAVQDVMEVPWCNFCGTADAVAKKIACWRVK